MKNHLSALFLFLVCLVGGSAGAFASEITGTFTGKDIVSGWTLSKYGEAEDPEVCAWGDVTEKGVFVDYQKTEYHPWINSNQGFNYVTKVEVEVYSEYSRMGIDEIRVGSSYFTPEREYGLDYNPEKTFIFLADDASQALGQVYIGFRDISDKPFYIKSIKVTYNPDGANRNLKWSVTELTVNLGESFDNPTLYGETTGVAYSSSNPDIAEIDAAGIIQPLKAGKTEIKATCPAAYPWAAGECSYTLNVEFALTGAGTSESIVLTKAGTLRDKVLDLESTKIRSLTLSGPINSEDIAYMRETSGRFTNLQEIDLTNATVVADEKSYATMFGGNHDVGMGSTSYVFVLSNEEKIEEKSVPTGLGGGKVTVTYYGNQLAGAFNSMPNLKRLILPSEITEIAPFVVAGSTGLIEIGVPENYTTIGEQAFGSCSNLHSISHSDECVTICERAFANSGILDFDLSKVETIGEAAFRKSSLRGDINLTSLTKVARSAFAECKDLKRVEFGNGLVEIESEAFYRSGIVGTLIIPDGCKTIGQSAFAGTAINDLKLPVSCIDIDCYTFSQTPWLDNELNRINIDEIVYADNVALYYKSGNYGNHTGQRATSIAFKEGTTAVAARFESTVKDPYFHDHPNYITKITLPESMIWIGDEAFESLLGGVTEIKIPANVRHIGKYAFSEAGFETLTVGANVEHIGDYAFSRCNSLIKLAYNAPNAGGTWIFYRCEGLESVTLGKNVKRITDRMFCDCQSLRKVEIEGINTSDIAKAPQTNSTSANGFSIGESAFASCSRLTTFSLPSDLKEIGDDAFSGVQLRTVFCFAAKPVSGLEASGIFENRKSTTIYVPQESVALFKSSEGWRKCTIIGADMSADVEESIIDLTDPMQEVEVYDLNGIMIYRGVVGAMQLPAGPYIIKTEKNIYKTIMKEL